MCSSAENSRANIYAQIKSIDIEDLAYIERDLRFYELVSLGFLLFGDNHANAEYVLQKLLICARALANDQNQNQNYETDLLRKYASENPINWQENLIETLSIIGANHILRKLGLEWQELRQNLPHIAEIKVQVHPLLKCLYKMCEQMTEVQAGDIIKYINESSQRSNDEHLRFYDASCLEVYILDWLTHRIIKLGDLESEQPDVNILVQYFKKNEMHNMEKLLVETINSITENKSNCNEHISAPQDVELTTTTTTTTTGIGTLNNGRTCTVKQYECYEIKRNSAGIILIINQREFHEEQSEELKELLPKVKLAPRRGTDVDKDELIKVLTSFGYKSDNRDNLTSIEMLHVIRETVKRSLLYDSLIVCIMSHGIDGVVYGANSIPVKIADIEKIIIDDMLKGKPKMLIVQACQKADQPVSVPSHSGVQIPTADKYTDLVKAMSTVSGFESMRHSIEGTWFIQEFCKAVNKYGNTNHLLDILMIVQKNVSDKRGDENQMMVPVTINTLRKFFFLPRRNSADIN